MKNAFWILPDTKTGLYGFHSTSTVVKTALKIYPDPQTGVHDLHRTSWEVRNAFLAHPATQTGVYKLHNINTVMKTAFSIFPHTQTGLHELDRTTVAKPGFWIFPDTQTGVHKLHRTSTMLKTALWIILTLKQVCTSFTGPSQWCKMPFLSILILNQASTSITISTLILWCKLICARLFQCQKDSKGSLHHCGGLVKLLQPILSIRKDPETWYYHCCGPMKLVQASLGVKKDAESFTGSSQWWKMPSEPLWQTGVHKLHNDENCLLNIFWHTNLCEQAAQDLHIGENDSLDHSWHPKWTAKPSQDFHSSRNSFQGHSWETDVKELQKTSTMEKTAFWIISDTETGVNKIHKTTTVPVVKTDAGGVVWVWSMNK